MRIGILSDTHIPTRARELPTEVISGMTGVDLIIHAGDIVEQSVLSTLAAIAPVHAVHGNMDPPPLRRALPRTRVVEVQGYRIGVIHGDGRYGSVLTRALSAFEDVNCIVFGHSHRPVCTRYGDLLLLNPGSPTDRRLSPKHSYAILTVSAAGLEGEIVYFD
ncbi:MAG: metallophosphoesterase family protein [Firmicutes bacterium]|nr:metallophosphoesterase family protein [Bacillota bacterium]